MLLYDYQYDIAAMMCSLLLLAMYTVRHCFTTRSTKIFLAIIGCDFIASAFDIISILAISHPDRYPLWLNYVSALGYLFFFNMMSVLYFLYIDKKTKVKWIQKPVKIIVIVSAVFYVVTICSSPWTHLIAYFDENLTYCHGPLFVPLYVIPFIMFALEIILFICARHHFNLYQLQASVSFILVMAACLVVQILSPRTLIGTLGCAVILFFIYVAFENPAFFTYRDTQCLNRPAFIQVLRRHRDRGEAVDLVIIGIRDFEYMSRTRGQSVADSVHTKIAEYLYRYYRDNAFYLGVDRYVLLFPTATGRAKEAEQQVRKFFSEPIAIPDEEIPLNVTVTSLPALDESYRSEDIEGLIGHIITDSEKSGNSHELLKEFIEKQTHREAVLHIVREATEKDAFEVYFQPIRNVHTGKYESAEALIRYRDPEMGFLNPEEMITLAEEYGLINRVGEQVFRKVCAFIKKADLTKLGIHYIEINLSPVQCMQPDLTELFAGIMKEFEIDAADINLEITETARTANEKTLLLNINRLAEKGVSFSIDDYGSGFASADYLIKLPVALVKIDKMILWEAMKNASAMTVLTNTIRMIKELGRSIVVEGVEDEEMVRVLTENGCDYMQGYFYSKPLNPEAFVQFLKENNQ